MTEQDELITRALAVLETYPSEDEERPATVAFFPPDSRSFFRGNRDGYVKLAIAALRAAQGEKQKFDKHANWFRTEDLDWAVGGFEPDESAHIYQPPRRTRLQEIRGVVLGGAILILFFSCLVVGFITIEKWIFK